MSHWSIPLWLLCYALVFIGLSVFGAHRFRILWLYLKNRKNPPQILKKFEQLPYVTIQLPMFNESDVVERLLETVGKMDYPKDRLQIQILDDSTDHTPELCKIEAEKLRAKGFDVEYLHRVNRVGFKAGALEEANKSAKGEFLLIFDADFIPQPDLLHKMIHYFTSPRVGVVQARWGHLNKKDSLLTRLQAMMLDGHLILEQVGRSRSKHFLNFNGTAGIWRKAAIDDAGGWEHDTLTEDMDLSYRAQMNGWEFIYLEDVVVPAELPPDMEGFKSQQHRWTKGSVQVCKKVLPKVWDSDEPLSIKLEATAHLTANFAYLLMFAVVVLVYPANFMFPNSWQKAVLFDLPVFCFASLSVILFYLSAQGFQRKHGWLQSLPYLPFLLALGIGMSISNGKAVLEALFNQESEFVRTPKYGSNAVKVTRSKRFKYLRSPIFWIESSLALYFTYLLLFAIFRGQWISIPFIWMFQFGFSYVALSPIIKSLKAPVVNPSTSDSSTEIAVI